MKAENNRQIVKTNPSDASNNPMTTKKSRKKELWHDDCIFPHRKMAKET